MTSWDEMLKLLDERPFSSKDDLELLPVCKFLCNLDGNVKKWQKTEKPDFYVEFEDGLKIGIELTRLLSDYAEQILYLSKLVDNAEGIFKEKYPCEDKVFAEIRFINDELSYKINERKKLSEEIADYVFCVLNNKKCRKPEFLEPSQRIYRKHPMVTFFYQENCWKQISLTKEKLTERIREKEEKLPSYRENKKELTDFWLVLLTGSMSSYSFVIDESINYSLDSTFDKVFLYFDFHNKIICVK